MTIIRLMIFGHHWSLKPKLWRNGFRLARHSGRRASTFCKKEYLVQERRNLIIQGPQKPLHPRGFFVFNAPNLL
ncbi:MAG: hypothetical protein RI842_10535, partial [Schleiferiaceae bacterium]|nr:hypothetical protein [Schleiferiaceae bacterium]